MSAEQRRSLAQNTYTPGRFLPTDSGLDVSDTVCTSSRCLESTDRCSGCKLEAIARAVWCVEASLFPVRWWWSIFNESFIEFIGERWQDWLSKPRSSPLFSRRRIRGKKSRLRNCAQQTKCKGAQFLLRSDGARSSNLTGKCFKIDR